MAVRPRFRAYVKCVCELKKATSRHYSSHPSLPHLLIIYKSLTQPLFDYCDVGLGILDHGLATKLLDFLKFVRLVFYDCATRSKARLVSKSTKLQKMQNRAPRIIR